MKKIFILLSIFIFTGCTEKQKHAHGDIYESHMAVNISKANAVLDTKTLTIIYKPRPCEEVPHNHDALSPEELAIECQALNEYLQEHDNTIPDATCSDTYDLREDKYTLVDSDKQNGCFNFSKSFNTIIYYPNGFVMQFQTEYGLFQGGFEYK
jgi:hypothetical protein